MDTLSHALIGIAVAGLSGHQLSPSDPVYIAAILGAQAPDLDIIAGLRGSVALLKQHRAVSHSLPGVAIWSALITIGMHFFMPDTSPSALFGWAFAGGLSHIIIDYFNTHGAAILWPLSKERKSCNLLNVFDPVLIVLLLSLYLYRLPMQQLSLASFATITLYIGLRSLLRRRSEQWLRQMFALQTISRLSVMPSLKRIFFWDFVIEMSGYYCIGQIGALYPVLEIKAELPRKAVSQATEMAERTRLGEFFSAFTPFCYIEANMSDEKTTVHIYDLRYHSNQEFRHHGTVILDEMNNPQDAYMHAYGKKIRFRC